MDTVLKGLKRTVVISPNRPTVMIGERINPTGKGHMSAALQAGDLSLIKCEAIEQVDVGALVLDVNVGAAGVNQVELLPRAVRLVMETTGVPVCIDTVNVEAMRAALEIHKQLNPNGRPLINSVSGKRASLEQMLPLAAEYDAAVIALCMDDRGISYRPAGRLAVAKKILQRAEQLNIPPTHVIIDCLAMTMGADHRAGMITLQSIHLLKAKLDLNMALGGSNASYGLPDRRTINGAFLAMAVHAGVNCPIVDVASVGQFIVAADLVMGRDPNAQAYIQNYRRREHLGDSRC